MSIVGPCILKRYDLDLQSEFGVIMPRLFPSGGGAGQSQDRGDTAPDESSSKSRGCRAANILIHAR